ncbi:MAG: 5-(carboxyamino)imidazole ribonucleotide mutase [Deltaproteobacteria bacterium]|nr:5-(carboxyamino)imidazole ribonucleotide mutase [Candidatus Anaeroferrophillus wilburensis]MBN2888458.1 5-(carboxyamino)imidazole ribonucleotide mutase [Deltaproteobacteria bacterium]
MTDIYNVLIIMGSDSDWEIMAEASRILRQFSVPHLTRVTSAHRTPERTVTLVNEAAKKGCQVIIAGAGAAAHLAGVVAAHTTLPVIGVPLNATSLQGMDALLATVQMPAGIPVATMAIGKAGATNSALLAIQILALADKRLAADLLAYRQTMVATVETKDKKLQQQINCI